MLSLRNLWTLNRRLAPKHIRMNSLNLPNYLHYPHRYISESKQLALPITQSQNVIPANSLFHQLHAKVSRLHLLDIDHVIIYLQGELVLLKRSPDGLHTKIASAPTAARDESYIQIKNLVHLTVVLTSLLEAVIEGKIKLSSIVDDLIAVSATLTEAQYSNNLQESDLALIRLSVSLITDVRACQHTAEIAHLLKQYLQAMQSINVVYARQAAVMQLSSIDKIMTEWLSTQQINLRQSRILLVGPDGPREGLIEKQFFDKMYSDTQTDSKVDYVTMLPKQMLGVTIEELVEELGKRELNRKIGKSMLNDERAMFKDILAPYAPAFLATLFAKKPRQCPMRLVSEGMKKLTNRKVA